MRILFFSLLLSGLVWTSSCKNGSKETSATPPGKTDTLVTDLGADDSSGQYLAPALAVLLPEWKASFKDFQPDSFHFSQRSFYNEKELQDTAGLHEMRGLFGPSLVYAADSTMFIDLYSYGMSLERIGKKLVATADVDMATSLCNLKTGQWKQIAFFGPSAGIEEAAWFSPTGFVLAGTMQNDEGLHQAFLLVGDARKEKLSWYESAITRPANVEYNASGLKKLKIDEWE